MKIDIVKIYQDIVDDLEKEWDKIQSCYKCNNVYFNIFNAMQYLNALVLHDMINVNPKELKDYESCVKILDKITSQNVEIGFQCFVHYTSNKEKLPFIRIAVSIERLLEDILRNLDNLDLLKEYNRLSLRHEFGHALDCLYLNNLKWEETIQILNERKNIKINKEKEYYKKRGYKEGEFGTSLDHYDEEYYRFYFSLPYEKEAEEYGKLDTEKHIKISANINRKRVVDLTKVTSIDEYGGCSG